MAFEGVHRLHLDSLRCLIIAPIAQYSIRMQPNVIYAHLVIYIHTAPVHVHAVWYDGADIGDYLCDSIPMFGLAFENFVMMNYCRLHMVLIEMTQNSERIGKVHPLLSCCCMVLGHSLRYWRCYCCYYHLCRSYRCLCQHLNHLKPFYDGFSTSPGFVRCYLFIYLFIFILFLFLVRCKEWLHQLL